MGQGSRFYQLSQILHDVVRKIEKLQFVQRVIFQIIDSPEKYKYLLISGHSCEKICNSKSFVAVTWGIFCKLSTMYIENHLFSRMNLENMLSFKARTMFFSNRFVLSCKSKHLVHRYLWYQNYFIGFKT